MAMTRKQLKELGLEADTVERLIAMHTETVEGLKAERDAWQEAAGQSEALKEERDRLMEQVTTLENAKEQAEQERNQLAEAHAAREEALAREAQDKALEAALLEQGANPLAVPLLVKAVDRAGMQMENGALVCAEEVLAPVREQYAAFFAAPKALCTELLDPPLGASVPMTREDLQAMDAEEINRNWDAVKSALQQVNA